jgi:hypothetical protein
MSFPVIRGFRQESIGVSTATSRGTTITAHASANTKGSYVQLTASSSFDSDQIIVTVDRTSSGPIRIMVDIAVGAAASEQVIISNLFTQPRSSTLNFPTSWNIPIKIPKGSRIAARCQASTGGTTCDISAQLIQGGIGFESFNTDVFSIGVDLTTTSTLYGFDVVSTNTKTAYTEMTASLARDITCLMVITNDFSSSTCSHLYDIAIGAAGSEQIIIPNIPGAAGTTYTQVASTWLFPCRILAGTRIAVRGQASSGSAFLILSLYGI